MLHIDFATLNTNHLTELAAHNLKGPLQDWEKTIWQFIQTWFNASEDCITVSTSGSTGVPKQIKHTKQAMSNSAAMTCRALNLEPGNTCLLCLPAHKIGGMMMLVRCIYNKMNLYCIRPSATPLANLQDDIKIDFAAFTPMQLYPIVEDKTMQQKAELIDKIILGGENAGGKLLNAISSLKNEVYLTFGMTETISHIALKKISGKNKEEHFNTLPGITVKTDEQNCLIIETPSLGQPDLHTNDIVKVWSPTQFDWLGRADHVINTGGIKVHPEDMEQKLQGDIEPAFFINAVTDELTGEKIVLAIESPELSKDEISRIKALLTQFDKIQRPKKIIAIPRFIRTENGKIKRKESLQQPGSDGSI